MPFFVKIEGQTFNLDDLTLEEAIALEGETGASWLEINPYSRAAHAKACIVTVAARLGKRDEWAAKVGGMTIAQTMDLLDFTTDDDLPTEFEDGIPKAEDATTTL